MNVHEDWHAEPQALQQYAAGTVVDTVAWSVEAHLPNCEVCRARLAGLLTERDRTSLEARRQELRLTNQPAVGASGYGYLPWPRAVSRGVLGPWWAWAGAVTAAFAGVTSLGLVPVPSVSLLDSWAAALAPLVPLAMVAMIYAVADRDPAATMTPRGGLELLLIRCLAVLTASVPTVTLAMLVGHGNGVVWLLPGLALCAGALALGSSMGVERSCVGLGLLWVVVVMAAAPPVRLASAASLIEPSGSTSVLWAGVLVVAVGAFATQRDRFDLPGRLS